MPLEIRLDQLEIRLDHLGCVVVVPEPTASMRKRREVELEKDKKAKIAEGFYQSKSDEDDTLEPIKSLKEEVSDAAGAGGASVKKAGGGKAAPKK